MAAGRIGKDEAPIPELDANESTAERITENVVNTFTTERDTSLADGAGAPGSTAVGGSRRDYDDDTTGSR